MSNNNSDHKKPFTNLTDYLPEVYKSDVNKSVFDAALNRHLTKDDTVRVAGYIGEKNNVTIVNRQVSEPTPHRQAYQLAPTMVSKVGTTENALSYKAFQAQLRLMGVDVDRMPKWANTTQFNWVPPTNIDMIVNYQDYFWSPADPQSPAQYITIENRCNKSKSKIASYDALIEQRGSTFDVTNVEYKTNSITITGLNNDLFIAGFLLYTKSLNNNFSDVFWTVERSEYLLDTNETRIFLIEPISTVSNTAPPPVRINQWWFDTTINRLKGWSGEDWNITIQQPVVQVSLQELSAIYQTDANCACNQDYGWDINPWDDNQLLPASVGLWSTPVLDAISHPTEAAWTNKNGTLDELDNDQYKIWHDTSTDQLKEYSFIDKKWKVSSNKFSVIVAQTNGNTRWDQTVGCEIQEISTWSAENQWIHKSQIQQYPNARRAALPILEYSSSTELNKWSKRTHQWSYAPIAGAKFELSNISPSRLELEPIKGYVATNINGSWYLYLANAAISTSKNVDYTNALPIGSKIRITDDNILSEVYSIASVEYREVTAADPMANKVGINQFVTIVRLDADIFTAPVEAGSTYDENNTRIVPVLTSTGDTWIGYHVHWVLRELDEVVVASESAALNIYKKRDNVAQIDLLPQPQYLPHYDSIRSSKTFLELTVLSSTMTEIYMHPSVKAGDTDCFAMPNSDELRIYVNGIRQYGSYKENISHILPKYTVVGSAHLTDVTIPYVSSVVFAQPLPQHAIVRVEYGVAAMEDMGMNAVPVRTIEDETQFAIAVATGTQPVYRSLSTYVLREQVKSETNQYPLFNVYDVVTSKVVKASPIFAYREDSSAAVNPSIGRRVIASADGREFEFEQFLLDRDDNILYGYRALDSSPRFWYSPLTNVVKFWDGSAWSEKILVVTTAGVASRIAVVATFDPANKLTLPGEYWYNPIAQVLSQRVNDRWVVEPNLLVNGSDPLMRTIWRKGTNQYIPKYVDSNRQPIDEGSLAGDWELLNQWMLNPEHQNKQVIKYTQLLTHFNTVLQSQPPIPGLPGGGVYTLSQDDYNYGIGGTIKEHNDGFDTLISAVNVSNTTPINVIEFAAQQYAASMTMVRELFNRHISLYAGQLSKFATSSIGKHIAGAVITAYEGNDFASQVFGDTSAYNKNTAIGIQNWIATAPMFGLATKYQPHVSVDGRNVSVFHHDGHRSTVSLTPGDQDRLSKLIVKLPDARGKTQGVLRISPPPATQQTYQTAVGHLLRPGAFWYQLGSGTRRLYRLSAYDVSNVAPSLRDGTIPDGTKYYNTALSAVFTKRGNEWIQTATGGNISSLWEIVDFSVLLAQTYLEIEQRLFDATPDRTALAYDFASLQVDEPHVYAKLYEARFMQYVAEHEIAAPLLNITYAASNAFTWNYAASPVLFPPAISKKPCNAGSWQALYSNLYGTPYPHLEPWKLQGFHEKPQWWDQLYVDTTGARRWKYDHINRKGMWENIRRGIIPAGQRKPNGSISIGEVGAVQTYYYFSVNISNAAILGGYAPDALLPPYFDVSQYNDPSLRSAYTSYTEIVAPDSDYGFGDMGPTEWQWTVSSQYVYDNAIIAFQMQPARMLHSTFGPQYTLVDGLQIETTLKQVYSHEDVLFHGDIYETNKTYHVRGLNQWYINLNRYNNFDTNGEFRELWAGWSPKLTYQFAGIVDTGTIELSNRYFDIIEQDYHILLANNGVVRDLWTDALNVSLINIPPAIIQYNNQTQWKMEIDTVSTLARSIRYYGVKSYPVTAHVSSDEFSMFQYPILLVEPTARRIRIPGDASGVFNAGDTVSIVQSPANGGTYTVVSATYISAQNYTRIAVSEAIPTAATVGFVVAGDKSASWVTGTSVVFSTTKFLPAPLHTDTAYYVIMTGPRTFKLAESPREAEAGIWIEIDTIGTGYHTVSEIDTSFTVFGGKGNSTELWFHYAIDRSDVRMFTPPLTVMGMQSFVNIMDGYGAYQKDAGLLVGVSDSGDFDELTGRLVDWALETERFIDWAFGMRNMQVKFNDAYPVRIDTHSAVIDRAINAIKVTGTNWTLGTPVRLSGSLPSPLVPGATYYIIPTATPDVFLLGTESSPLVATVFMTAGGSDVIITSDRLVFTQSEPVWKSGTAVVLSSTGTLPDPIVENAQYYIVQTGVGGYVQLSYSAAPTDTTAYVELMSTGTGMLSLSLFDSQRTFPSLELNPTRNNIWIDTPLGVLADVIEGPYTDIRIQQTIYDQYNRPIGPDQLSVYREDRRSHIAIRPEIANDIDLGYVDDPYNYIHIGGGHFFTEGYEHFLIMNNTTIDGSLIYDPFLGLYTKRFDMDYFEKEEYTLRPTLGGFYLLDGKFQRNIEGATEDMRNYYDTFALSETSEVARRSRKLLGYTADMGFLDWLNVNEKTKFLFYKGMIQTKGSINSVNAYINSKRFVDAKIDEFWALKQAEFGDARPRFYPRIKLYSTDAAQGDVRLKFLTQDDNPTDLQYVDAEENGFHLVNFASEDRWASFPEQREKIKSPLFLDAEVTKVVSTWIGTIIPPGAESTITYMYNPATNQMFMFDYAAKTWSINVTAQRIASVSIDGRWTVYINHGIPSDDIRVHRRNPQSNSLTNYTTDVLSIGTGPNQYLRTNSESVRITGDQFYGIIDIYIINASADRSNPAKLIDTQSNTVVTEIPLWHPAIGIHSHLAAHNIDLFHSGDPARYETTLNATAPAWHKTNAWNNLEVGTSWLDTSVLGYVPYYDNVIFPAVNDRLFRWGKLAPWSSVRVYEWVQSTVPPAEWDAVVLSQINSNIAPGDKATGTPKMATFRRQRSQLPVVVSAVDSRLTAASMNLVNFDQVLINADIMPTGLLPNVKYIVSQVIGNTFRLVDPASEQLIVLSDVGYNVRITKAFDVTNWRKHVQTTDRTYGPTIAILVRSINNISNLTNSINWANGYQLPSASVAWVPANPELFTDNDVVDVYVNGKLRDSGATVTKLANSNVFTAAVTAPFVINEYDVIDIVKAEHIPTSEELEFNPDIGDDGTIMVQWTRNYEYTTRTATSGDLTTNQTPTTYYHFWVEHMTSRRPGVSGLSVEEVSQQLAVIPLAHMVVQTPTDDIPSSFPDPYNITPDVKYSTPIMYRDAIVRRISGYLSDDNRYVVQFARDLALRDDITSNGSQMNLKNKHQEWVMFRREQAGTIDRMLWDRLTESLIGYTLKDHTIAVPNPSRELYDSRNNTDTRFGLGVDQAFVDKTLALGTVLAYLRDPTKDFTPTDINTFFVRYSFDTPAEIERAMDAIYTSFSATHVNNIWFEALQDALSKKSRYAELMKTSWIALHGIRVLEVGGLFD